VRQLFVDRPIFREPAVLLLTSPLAGVSASLLRFSLWILVLVALVDPGDKLLHAKAPVFAGVLLLWFLRKGLTKAAFSRLTLVAILGVAIVLPWFWGELGYLTGTVRDLADLGAACKAYAFVILFFVILDEHIDLDLMIAKAGFVVAGFVLGVCALYFVSPIVYAAVYQYTLDKDLALLNAERDLFGLGLGSFYYKTSAVLVISLGYSLQRVLWGDSRKWVHCFLVLFYAAAIVASGARANLLGAVLVFGFLIFRKIDEKFGRKSAFLFGTLLLALVVGAAAKQFLNPQEASNQVKLQHYRSYLAEFSENPHVLIWGQGLGTSFYTSGFDRYTAVTELSYLDLLRQFGIPLTLLLGGLLTLPMIWAVKKGATRYLNPYLVPAYLGYLFIAGTNPLLVSSTGLLVVVAMQAQCVRALRKR
jgi:hypothetical protein